MQPAEIIVKLDEMPALLAYLRRVGDFITEFARHADGCPAAEWSGAKPECACGYDEELEGLRAGW